MCTSEHPSEHPYVVVYETADKRTLICPRCGFWKTERTRDGKEAQGVICSKCRRDVLGGDGHGCGFPIEPDQLIARVAKRNERGDPIVILVDDRAFIASTVMRSERK